jgi:hypothetical protein
VIDDPLTGEDRAALARLLKRTLDASRFPVSECEPRTTRDPRKVGATASEARTETSPAALANGAGRRP